MLCGDLRRFRVLAPLGPKKSHSKRPSKTYSTSILSVLAPFWRAKMAPKSMKNQYKLNFRAFPFPHRFLNRFLMEFCSQLRPAGSPKSTFFIKKYMVKKKKRLSKITSISASILVPTCLHVGLQNGRFSEIIAFQEAFKILSFFASTFLSILGPSWPPTWGHLGGRDRSKFENLGSKKCWR